MESSPATLRLFLGLPVQVHESLASAIKKTRIGADKRDMEINWVPTANYHITLNFLGSTPHALVPQITALARAIASRHAPFTTQLRGMGGFPDEHHMRTLWVGVRHTRALAQIQNELRERLVQTGIPQEERSYTPHLTIGKTRKSRNATDLISPFVRTKFGEIAVDGLLLYESQQYGPHTSYHVLERIALTGEPRNEDETAG